MNSTNSDFINGIIGKLIREYREKAGYSQNDLAKKSGLSQQHISQVELGKRNIGSDQLVMLGLLLGFSLYDIQERLNAQPTTASLATIDDYDVVWKLDPYITTDLLTSHIKNDQVYLLWTPDQAVGACRYSLFNLVFPLLDHLYIDEHHRGMRYGTALLEYWENAMKELGYGHVMLSIQESNTARIFFEKFGYQCVGSYSLPFQDCDDLMYMKELE